MRPGSCRGVRKRWCAELVELRERGVEVCLVEELAAIEQIAFDGQNADPPRLGFETLLRGPMPRLGQTAPSLLSRCTASI